MEGTFSRKGYPDEVVLPIIFLGNDMYTSFFCECNDPLWADDETLADLLKREIKFTGYNDKYFFDVVNAKPRVCKCDCGREYWFQWKRDGVHIWPKEEE